MEGERKGQDRKRLVPAIQREQKQIGPLVVAHFFQEHTSLGKGNCRQSRKGDDRGGKGRITAKKEEK